MSNVVDLDAARAAKQEQNPNQTVIRFKGQEWPLPVEMPLDITEPLIEVQKLQPVLEDPDSELSPDQQMAVVSALREIIKNLLGDRYEAFKALRLGMSEYQAFVEAALGSYGVNQGNSGASAES